MRRMILVILLGMVLYPFCSAQQKMYGYKYSGNGDILSDCFFIQEGFFLDSVVSTSGNITYRFEYDEQGRLKRDYNFVRFDTIRGIPSRPIVILLTGTRDYYYTAEGAVDSVGYGHLSGNVWVNDSFGFKNHFSPDAKITSVIYWEKDSVTRVIEKNYDPAGNLILNKDSSFNYTVITSCEYDSQNRIKLRNTYTSGNPNIIQYVYRYESSGDINCALQSISNGDTIQAWNYNLQFDFAGKAVNEVYINSGAADTQYIAFSYDGSDRILKMGSAAWYHYNKDGNLDSLANIHMIYAGYLGGRATVLDSYGNTISLTQTNFGQGDICNLYYSQKGSGVTTSRVNKRAFILSQNYPNPFNPSTIINYQLPKQGHVSIKVYDLLGREIAVLVNEIKATGRYYVTFDGSKFSSGVYFIQMTVQPKDGSAVVQVKKMLLTK